MKYVHVFIPERHYKFSISYINFIRNHIGEKEHFFIQYRFHNNKNNYTYNKYANIPNKFISIFPYFKFLANAEKIILHSLDKNMVLFLLLFPRLRKKCYWIMWGGDLYYYLESKRSIKAKLYELARRIVIRDFHGFITILQAQYDYLKDWYKVNGKHIHSFTYPSNLFKDFNGYTSLKEKNRILIGHSANESNRHLEVFKKIENLNYNGFDIVCPLSYSEKESYREEVIKTGRKIFEDNFIAVQDFLPFDDYMKMLKGIDIAIFNNDRQQAFGNIVTLLGFGVKVYLQQTSILYQFFKGLGVEVFSVEQLDLNLLDEKIKKKNQEIIKNRFSRETLIKELNELFDN